MSVADIAKTFGWLYLIGICWAGAEEFAGYVDYRTAQATRHWSHLGQSCPKRLDGSEEQR